MASTPSEIQAEIERQLRRSTEADADLQKFMQSKVVPYWKQQTPVDHGAAAASVKVTQKAHRGKGRVSMTDWKAHFLEYGTGEPGPTPEYAPGAKTAHHFGGDLEGGITDER